MFYSLLHERKYNMVGKDQLENPKDLTLNLVVSSTQLCGLRVLARCWRLQFLIYEVEVSNIGLLLYFEGCLS